MVAMATDRRGARSGRKSRAKRAKASSPAAPEPEVYVHPVFGPIPLLVRSWTDADGQHRSSYEFDPDYQPPLPSGAVRGEPFKQRSRGVFDIPRYFYVDHERVCVQCREPFVFAAVEQKRWYETLGFDFASVAIRCPSCRRQRRLDKALHHAVDDAKRELAAQAEDASAHLALAEAIVTLRARNDRGKLDEALAAARKARRLLRDQPASAQALTHYWEARALALDGRTDRAAAAYEAFLAIAKPKAHRQQIREAEAWLERRSA
jgi:tetratricopeptide (TPR) repeat protein